MQIAYNDKMMCEQCNSNLVSIMEAPLEMQKEQACQCPTGMSGRYIQPCLLLVLSQKDSYGYELIEEVRQLGAAPDASGVYRTLRRMEKEGLVKSEWITEGTGPARRFYKITPEGEDLLHSWVAVLEDNRKSLERFLNEYDAKFRKERK